MPVFDAVERCTFQDGTVNIVVAFVNTSYLHKLLSVSFCIYRFNSADMALELVSRHLSTLFNAHTVLNYRLAKGHAVIRARTVLQHI